MLCNVAGPAGMRFFLPSISARLSCLVVVDCPPWLEQQRLVLLGHALVHKNRYWVGCTHSDTNVLDVCRKKNQEQIGA